MLSATMFTHYEMSAANSFGVVGILNMYMSIVNTIWIRPIFKQYK
jgi:hypothetical protein